MSGTSVSAEELVLVKDIANIESGSNKLSPDPASRRVCSWSFMAFCTLNSCMVLSTELNHTHIPCCMNHTGTGFLQLVVLGNLKRETRV